MTVKKAFWPILCSILFSVLVIAIAERYFYPQELKGVYNLDSGYNVNGAITPSTEAVLFPDYLCYDGEFLCENETGYDICIFTSTSGFHILNQGMHRINGRPIAFFIVKPSANNQEGFGGWFIIHEKDKRLVAKYQVQACSETELLLQYALCFGN